MTGTLAKIDPEKSTREAQRVATFLGMLNDGNANAATMRAGPAIIAAFLGSEGVTPPKGFGRELLPCGIASLARIANRTIIEMQRLTTPATRRRLARHVGAIWNCIAFIAGGRHANKRH